MYHRCRRRRCQTFDDENLQMNKRVAPGMQQGPRRGFDQMSGQQRMPGPAGPVGGNPRMGGPANSGDEFFDPKRMRRF